MMTIDNIENTINVHHVPVKLEWDQQRQLETILAYREQMLKRRRVSSSNEVDVYVPKTENENDIDAD